MEETIFEQVAVGSMMIVLVSIMFLPMVIWDSQTGRYHGYLNWKSASVLLFTAIYFGYRAHVAGHDSWQISAETITYVGQAVIGSRIFVELSNYSMHKVWLHRQYHKLTGHEDS